MGGVSVRRIAIALTAAVALPGAASSHASETIHVGEMAPDAKITLIDGTAMRLTDLRGKVVVFNFWATWCGPCREELPILDAYYGAMKDAGLRVFAVTTEDSLPIQRLKRLFAAMTVPAARRIDGPYAHVSAVPTNHVIDRAGRVRYAKANAFTLDDLNEILVPLLREPAPAAAR